MKIINTKDLSYNYEGCTVYKSVTLIEEFGMYTLIKALKVIGGPTPRKEIYCRSNPTCDFETAKHHFEEAIKKYE